MKLLAGRSRSRISSGYLALMLVLVVMVVLLAGATWQALRAEASHRATAERTLRDYSAIAAWNFGQKANQVLHGLGGAPMEAIDLGNESRGAALAVHPSVLIAHDTMTCDSVKVTMGRFAFRIDLPDGRIVTAGQVPPESDLRELVAKLPPLMRRGGSERHRFVAPGVGGRPMRLAAMLNVRADSARTPLAIYGVAFDSVQLARALSRIVRQEDLLPPVLLGPEHRPDDVMITVRTPDGHVLYASGERRWDTIGAVDTMAVEQGHLVVEASVNPALAPSLVIGGLPSSRLPALLGVLAFGVVLAGIGFFQLRRERELMRLRSRFVANVSHELRTPLAQISMFGETLMLGRARTPEEQHHFASVIHREARRLSSLVEGVLRFSRADAGRTALRLEPCGLAAELRETVEDFAPLARASGARLHVEADDAIVASIDPAAVRQILMNLLENATKYGPGRQRVVVRAVAHGELALVSVDDEGPGIPLADRQRVLEPFTRLDRDGQRKVAGTGIGLSVVDELVRAMGGRLWIEDAPGSGARVCFTLARVPGTVVAAGAGSTATQDAILASR